MRHLLSLLPGNSFTPKRLPNLGLWLEADKIAGLADGAAVSPWRDVSGNRYHATQATAANRPTYKVGIVNGRPVVRFDGSNDILNILGGGLALTRNAPAVTVLSVLQTTAPGAVRTVMATSNNGGSARTLLRRENVAGQLTLAGRRVAADATDTISGGVIAASVWSIDIAVFDFTNRKAYLYQNGVLVSQDDTFASAGLSEDLNSSEIAIGGLTAGSQLIDGDMAALVVWRRALPLSEILLASRHYSHKYAITLHTAQVRDSFNRANSATSLGTSDTGHVWTAHLGTWGISGNQAYLPTFASTTSLATVAAGLADGIVYCTLATTGFADGGQWIVFRYQDNSNYWYIEANPTTWTLNKVVAGVLTNVGTTVAVPANGDRIRILLSGSTIQTSKNDLLQAGLSTTDTDLQAATRHGLGAITAVGDTAARWENFEVWT